VPDIIDKANLFSFKPSAAIPYTRRSVFHWWPRKNVSNKLMNNLKLGSSEWSYA